MIFPPGSSSPLPESPAALEKSPKRRLLPRQEKSSMHGSMQRIDRSCDPSGAMLTDAVKVELLTRDEARSSATNVAKLTLMAATATSN